MPERVYIDCFATIGSRGPKDPAAPYEASVLLDEMEWCGIHGALVAHATAREYDPMFGNRLLAEITRKTRRLYGVWAVMPHHTGEMARAHELVRQMQDNGIRAAKMYPRAHRYPFNMDTCGELLGELEVNQIPLLVEGGNLYHPDVLEPSNQVLLSELDPVLERFPDLPVILQGARWDATRYLYWLMRKHKNLMMEFSAHQGNRALEKFVEWFGPDRLLFGTGAMGKAPGAAKAFVDYCTLEEDAKRKIAGGNLARLLRLREMPPEYRQRKLSDPILASARAGQPLKKTLVIDAHAHINHDDAEGIGFIHSTASDAAAMRERARTMGIDQMCISSFLAIWVDHVRGNTITVEAMRRFPGFYHGYAVLSPQYVTHWPSELRRVHRTYKMGGLKPYYPRTGIPYNHKLWAPWFEYGNRINGYTLIHPSPDVVREINEIAPRYPNMVFIIAHSGGSYGDARAGVEIALRNPNVYLEITLTTVTFRVIEFMVEQIGADRVLFGTDQPMRDPIPQFGWMVYSRCSPEEKKKMLGINMRRILRRVRL